MELIKQINLLLFSLHSRSTCCKKKLYIIGTIIYTVVSNVIYKSKALKLFIYYRHICI